MKGNSLGEDLKSLVNDPKYSDIEILCKDEKKLYGCRAVLAARSEVFDRLLYNGMKESFEKQISFPSINSSEMEIILEYIHTGLVREESLTKDNIIETFYTADYFQLLDLQNLIMTILEINFIKDYSPELLSKVAEIMPLVELEDSNVLLNRLVETVAIIPLNNIEFGRFSITGFQLLLSCTHEKEKAFMTPEYEVFRYSVILAAKQVSNDVHETLMKQLPTLEQLEGERLKDSINQIENKIIITDRQEVVKELEPLIEFIDFRRIKTQILDYIVKLLKIIPAEIISDIYQCRALSENSDLNSSIRGTQYIWDESGCGSKLIIEDNGKIVRTPDNYNLLQSVRANIILDKGIFEWDIIIGECCHVPWVGVCALENFNYEEFAGYQSTGWVLGSGGNCKNSNKSFSYCPPFNGQSSTKITIHLDMNKGSCAFSVDGKRYPEVSRWNLPSKLYPVVSFEYSGRVRIQPH